MDPAAQVILGEGGPEKGIRPENLLQVAGEDLIPLDFQEALAGGEDRPLPVVPGQEAGDIRGGSQLAVKGDADVSLRGREMAHQDMAFELMDKVSEALSQYAEADGKPKLLGRNISVNFAPKN